MRVPPGTSIVLDEMAPQRWRIVIPGRANRTLVFVALACLCWLAGWAVGEVFALRTLFSQEKDPGVDLSMIVWLLAWTAGGVAAMWLLRRVADAALGIETLLLTPERIRLIRTLWGVSSISDHALEESAKFDVNARWGFRMTVGKRRVVLGIALTTDERVWIVEELQRVLSKVRGDSDLLP